MAAPREPQDHKSKKSAEKAPAPTSLVEIVRPEAEEELAPIPVFRLDGEIYTMPARVPVRVSLATLTDVSTLGYEVAIVTAVRKTLGDQAWAALMACDYLTEEQIGAILEKVTDHITGAMEEVASSGK